MCCRQFFFGRQLLWLTCKIIFTLQHHHLGRWQKLNWNGVVADALGVLEAAKLQWFMFFLIKWYDILKFFSQSFHKWRFHKRASVALWCWGGKKSQGFCCRLSLHGLVEAVIGGYFCFVVQKWNKVSKFYQAQWNLCHATVAANYAQWHVLWIFGIIMWFCYKTEIMNDNKEYVFGLCIN